jgi:transcription elongation factor Elf1
MSNVYELIDYRIALTDAQPKVFVAAVTDNAFACPLCGQNARENFVFTRVSLTNFMVRIVCDNCRTILSSQDSSHAMSLLINF